MSSKPRIVITGLGVVSALGNQVHSFYEALLAGKSGIGPITTFPCEEFATRFAGSVTVPDTEGYLEKKQARRVDPYILYGLVAGKDALVQAGCLSAIDAPVNETVDKSRCGILIGSGMGGMGLFSENVLALESKGPRRVSPFFVPYIITNMPGALLAIDTGFMGPNYAISTACSTGAHCIVSAANHLRRGDADLIVCGGVEAPITPIGVAGFNACKALSQRNDDPTRASRPWDTSRDGFVLGEGAGVLVLETLDHALKRGAPILAEYLGGAVCCDAYHMTDPREDGAGVALCVRLALSDAGVTPERINHINAHATSTPVGDMAEIRALQSIFSNPEDIAINATKSMLGHACGAAPGIEAVATVMAIQTGQLHPTINLEHPEADLHFKTSGTALPWKIDVALSTSFGFGGHNAVLAFSPYRE